MRYLGGPQSAAVFYGYDDVPITIDKSLFEQRLDKLRALVWHEYRHQTTPLLDARVPAPRVASRLQDFMHADADEVCLKYVIRDGNISWTDPDRLFQL